MKILLKRVAVLFLLLCFQGCQTVRVIEGPTAAKLAAQIAVGDEVRVTAKDGREFRLRLTAIRDDAIVGIPPTSELNYTVRYETIRKIEKAEFSAGKTAGLMGGSTAVLYVVLIVVVVAGFKALGELGCLFSSKGEGCD